MPAPRYCTIDDLQSVHDERALQQLTSDTGTPASLDETNTILINAMEDAASEIRSEAQVGGIYSNSRLQALFVSGDWALIGTASRLAVVRLYERRGAQLPEAIDGIKNRVMQVLNDLRDGKRVFDDAAAIDAGQPKVVILSADDRNSLNRCSDSPFFPTRRGKLV